MLRQFTSRPARSLKHPPNWIRVDPGPEDEGRALARSYMARPINLILSRPDGEVVDGNRRLDFILLESGPDTPVPVCITDEDITPAIAVEIMLESAEHTKSLTPYEKAAGNAKWLELNPGKTARDLAERRHREPATISRSLSLFKCVDAVVSAARDGKITESDWVAMSSRPPDEQLIMLTARLSGAITSRDEYRRHGRKPGQDGGKPPVRAPKIKIPLANDAANGVVTVAGHESIDLDEAESLLKEAIKAVRAAREKNLDCKTVQSVWRDMAKAG